MRVSVFRTLLGVVLVALVAAGQVGCERARTSAVKSEERKIPIRLACKMHTEQLILMKILSIYLKERGYDVSEVHYMTTPVARAALEKGKIDLYWEYTGTALRLFYDHPAEANPQIAYQTISRLDLEKGVVWLSMTPANSTYSILMRRDKAEALGISSLSELAAYVRREAPGFLFASSSEFHSRVDGLEGMQHTYGFAFQRDRITQSETKLLYGALRDDLYDVVAAIATDGRIARYGLFELEDDLEFFPAYNGAPVIRQALLEKQPELRGLINRVPGLVSNATLKELTYQVDVERRDVFEVVRAWLEQNRLL